MIQFIKKKEKERVRKRRQREKICKLPLTHMRSSFCTETRQLFWSWFIVVQTLTMRAHIWYVQFQTLITGDLNNLINLMVRHKRMHVFYHKKYEYIYIFMLTFSSKASYLPVLIVITFFIIVEHRSFVEIFMIFIVQLGAQFGTFWLTMSDQMWLCQIK